MNRESIPSFLSRSRAVVLDRGRPVSIGEIDAESASVARFLAEIGLKPGDRLAIWLPNVPAWLAVFFACARVGITVLALNTRFKSHEVSDLVSRSRCKALVYWPGFRKIDFDGVLKGCDPDALKSVEAFVAYTEEEGAGYPENVLGKPVYRYADAKQRPALEHISAMPGSPCIMFTTSGTTSGPKFVVHDQQTIVSHAHDVAAGFGYVEEGTKVLLTLPLCGGFGFCDAMAVIAANRTLLMHPAFDAKEAVAAIHRERVTHSNGPDEVIGQMLDAAEGTPAFPSARCFGFASFTPVYADLAERAEACGLKLFGLYGSSELQALLARQDPASSLPDRAFAGGRLVAGAALVRARDPETGQVLGHGEKGELEFTAPSRMTGYFENDAANRAATTQDGWFRSGDLGYTSSDKDFVFLSRLGDVIRLSGFLVNPAEIEFVLQQHPSIESAQVVGIGTSSGNKAVAFAIPRAGAAFDEQTVLEHCARRMARYKVPAAVISLSEFPVTPGANATKIQKTRLREMALKVVSS